MKEDNINMVGNDLGNTFSPNMLQDLDDVIGDAETDYNKIIKIYTVAYLRGKQDALKILMA